MSPLERVLSAHHHLLLAVPMSGRLATEMSSGERTRKRFAVTRHGPRTTDGQPGPTSILLAPGDLAAAPGHALSRRAPPSRR